MNVNNPRWNTNLIGFNVLTTYGSPAFYVQKMLADNNGDEVLNASYAGRGTLKVIATKNDKTGIFYLMIVNSSDKSELSRIKVHGEASISTTGEVTVLTSASALDTNTINDPAKVVHERRSINNLSEDFSYIVPAFSVTILAMTSHYAGQPHRPV